MGHSLKSEQRPAPGVGLGAEGGGRKRVKSDGKLRGIPGGGLAVEVLQQQDFKNQLDRGGGGLSRCFYA